MSDEDTDPLHARIDETTSTMPRPTTRSPEVLTAYRFGHSIAPRGVAFELLLQACAVTKHEPDTAKLTIDSAQRDPAKAAVQDSDAQAPEQARFRRAFYRDDETRVSVGTEIGAIGSPLHRCSIVAVYHAKLPK